jgi:hypothetical protein
MTSAAKRKGSGFEREVVDLLRFHDLEAKKVPLSGALADYKGDVTLRIGDVTYTIECKRRKAGFRTLYGWLGNNDFLVFRDDKCEPLLVMSLLKFATLMGGEK